MPELPESVTAGTRITVHIAPFGQFVSEKKNQILDLTAMENLVADFKATGKDILVDCDHGSLEKDGSSVAYAWIKDLRLDPDKGLFADFEFTDLGAEAVAQRRYRFVSPAWHLDKSGRPDKLFSVSLTNIPNLPVDPVVNKAIPKITTQKEKTGMDKLAELLGLDPGEATDDDITAAVSALIARNKELESAQKEKEASDFVAENEDIVEDPDKLKEQFKEDPDLTKAVCANFRRARSVVRNSTRPPVVKNCANVGETLSKLPPNERAAWFAKNH